MDRKQAHRQDEQQFIVFLRIVGGINFVQDKPARKIPICASLDNNVLSTESCRPVTPGSGTATVNANLVWTCDRFSVQQMKKENRPIKIECFETFPDGRRCSIGCVVIALRTVPMVPLSRTRMIKPRWHRLVGIESERWRRRKPELEILAMITDPKYLETEPDGQHPSSAAMEEEEETVQPTTLYANPSPEQLEGNAELLEELGLLQIGSRETDTDRFLLTICLKSGQHLDQLAPGTDQFRVRYQLFGSSYALIAKRTKPGSAVFAVQEKISISMRSSLAALGAYLQDALKIAVDVVLPSPGEQLPSDAAVGKTTIEFVDFLKERDLADFLQKYSCRDNTLEVVRSYPIHDVHGGFPADGEAEQQLVPSLKCQLSLRFLSHDRTKEETTKAVNEKDTDEHGETNEITTPLEEPTSGLSSKESERPTYADVAEERISVPDAPTKRLDASSPPPLPLAETKRTVRKKSPKPPPTMRRAESVNSHERVDIESILQNTEQDLRDLRRTFAFSVRIGEIKFTSSSPSPGRWQFTLQHPKADTPFTRLMLELLPDALVQPERIDFGDLTLRLLFSTVPERVTEVIESEPSKLTLNGPHGMHALAQLDNASLLVGMRERQAAGVVVMVSGSTGENVAIASVSCGLEEVGLNYNSQLLREPPPVAVAAGSVERGNTPFDETVSYQLQEEQKAWMQEQREKFMVELQEKERTHLQALTRDWKLQRAEEERVLSERLAHAEAMAAALSEARRTLEEQAAQPNRQPPVQSVVQLERQFRDQLEMIRAKAVRIEQEAEAQIEATRRQCRTLQDQLTALTVEQQRQHELNAQLQRELDAERLGRAQERTELEQRLEELSDSKARYKELWAKVTRKAHQLEQELAVARTPYYQPRIIQRKTTSRAQGGGGSRMSMVSGAHQQGAGDCSSCCGFACKTPPPHSSCQ